jgi:hypothetical protein
MDYWDHQVAVFYDFASGSPFHLWLEGDTLAGDIPCKVCEELRVDYVPQLGVFRWDPTVDNDDDQCVEWIAPDALLTVEFLSDPFLVLVVRRCFLGRLQSNQPRAYYASIELSGHLRALGPRPVAFSIGLGASCRALPARICESLRIPLSSDYAAFRGATELPPDLIVADSGLRPGDAVVIKPVPKWVTLTVYTDRIEPGSSRNLSLSRSDRVADIARRAGYRADSHYVYLCDLANQTYRPVPKSAYVVAVAGPDAVFLLTQQLMAQLVGLRVAKWPHDRLFLDIDVEYEMTLGEVARWFVFGDERRQGTQFEAWRAAAHGQMLDVEKNLFEVGIAPGEEIVVRVIDEADRARQAEMARRIRFTEMVMAPRGEAKGRGRLGRKGRASAEAAYSPDLFGD